MVELELSSHPCILVPVIAPDTLKSRLRRMAEGTESDSQMRDEGDTMVLFCDIQDVQTLRARM